MTVTPLKVKSDTDDAAGGEAGGIAPLANVSLFAELAERLVRRHRDLPGIGVWYGPSGYGKTRSAVYGANRSRAFYVECGATWTQAKFVRTVARELGLPEKGTIADLVDRIVVSLKACHQPLIVDEADHVVSRRYVDLVREIHDRSGAAIILVGEENLPHALRGFERFHNRVLDWVPAQPCDVRDGGMLAALYAPGIAVAPDLLARIVKVSGGRTRRIVVNLDRVREYCALEGLDRIDLATWGDRSLYSGDPPGRRSAA